MRDLAIRLSIALLVVTALTGFYPDNAVPERLPDEELDKIVELLTGLYTEVATNPTANFIGAFRRPQRPGVLQVQIMFEPYQATAMQSVAHRFHCERRDGDPEWRCGKDQDLHLFHDQNQEHPMQLQGEMSDRLIQQTLAWVRSLSSATDSTLTAEDVAIMVTLFRYGESRLMLLTADLDKHPRAKLSIKVDDAEGSAPRFTLVELERFVIYPSDEAPVGPGGESGS